MRLVDECQRVACRLEVDAGDAILQVFGILAHRRVTHSQVSVLLGLVVLLCLTCIEGSVICHLTEILLFTLLRSLEERIVVGIEVESPVLQYTILIVLLRGIVSCINQGNTSIGKRGPRALVYLGFTLPFSLGSASYLTHSRPFTKAL